MPKTCNGCKDLKLPQFPHRARNNGLINHLPTLSHNTRNLHKNIYKKDLVTTSSSRLVSRPKANSFWQGKGYSAFPWIPAQPLLEPLLNMHPTSYCTCQWSCTSICCHSIPAIHETNALREVLWQRVGKFLLKNTIALCWFLCDKHEDLYRIHLNVT